jgi:SSS family solute:Na+ symporter
MRLGVNWPAVVVLVCCSRSSVLGFIAANWRRGDLDRLSRVGLNGRRFGTIVTWFLLGGDLYRVRSCVPRSCMAPVPRIFAMPYTIMYPLVFLIMPRFWSGRKHGYHCRRFRPPAVSDRAKPRPRVPLTALATAATSRRSAASG